MEFKIDTKPAYTIITPVSNRLDANLTGALRQKWKELTESGSQNLIADLHHCAETDETAAETLLSFHREVYEAQHSLVFCNLPPAVLAAIRAKDPDQELNLAPTLDEAVDIVSMEILERDLFNEES